MFKKAFSFTFPGTRPLSQSQEFPTWTGQKADLFWIKTSSNFMETLSSVRDLQLHVTPLPSLSPLDGKSRGKDLETNLILKWKNQLFQYSWLSLICYSIKSKGCWKSLSTNISKWQTSAGLSRLQHTKGGRGRNGQGIVGKPLQNEIESLAITDIRVMFREPFGINRHQ